MFTRKTHIKLTLSVILVIGFLLISYATPLAINTSEAKSYRVAIKGYDPVAYFTENRAIKGINANYYIWNEAKWYFSNTENRDLFAQNPERYAPQFGGHCANGISKGKLVAADPEQWTIVDGKLYLNYNRKARDAWRNSKATMIEEAEKNWAKMK
jgi:YHS domain-containing protein